MKLSKMFNRFSAIALSAVMLSAAAIPTFAVDTQPKGFIVDSVRDGSVEFQKNNAEMLDSVYRQILACKTKIDISQYHIPYDNPNYQGIIDAILGIYPELFFIDYYSIGSPTYIYEGGEFYMKELTISYSKTPEEIATMLDAFHKKADYYLSLVDDSMDEYTKALVLHDALIQNSVYRIVSEGSSVVDSTTYTFMVEGWGRCENYAECYAYLLSHVGIESELVNSDAMNHEWMKIHLDGSDYYYNVDVTWDDALVNGYDRPERVSHKFFLLSDDMIQNDDNRHYGYDTYYPSDGAYDGKTNLHSIDQPIVPIGGKFYTLYRTDNKGIIAEYDPQTDGLTDLYSISDKWYTSTGGFWMNNYSCIGVHEGLIYFNRENSVDVFDPATGQVENYIPQAMNDGRQLYGMFVRDGVIYGLASDSPNKRAEIVELGPCKENVPQDMLGDVTLDGVLDISDATEIQCFIAEIRVPTARQLAVADYNHDGEIDISDATDIQIAISR